MVEIHLAVAAAHSGYKARQCGQTIPELSRSDGFRFVAGLATLALIIAGLSLMSASSRPVSNQCQGTQHADPPQDTETPLDAILRPQAGSRHAV
jgi:hypothetical protein